MGGGAPPAPAPLSPLPQNLQYSTPLLTVATVSGVPARRYCSSKHLRGAFRCTLPIVQYLCSTRRPESHPSHARPESLPSHAQPIGTVHAGPKAIRVIRQPSPLHTVNTGVHAITRATRKHVHFAAAPGPQVRELGPLVWEQGPPARPGGSGARNGYVHAQLTHPLRQ